MSTDLQSLLQRPDIWRASQHRPPGHGVPTGFTALDACLHDGGWPAATLTELLVDTAGIGEWQLLLPTLARRTDAGEHCALIAPPYLPYAPALLAAGIDPGRLLVIEPADSRELVWCTGQLLRCGAFAAVVAWPGRLALRTAELRRLQLAAAGGNSLAFLYRDRRYSRTPSVAGLRIEITPAVPGLQLLIHKQRGGWGGQQVELVRPEPWLDRYRPSLQIAPAGASTGRPSPNLPTIADRAAAASSFGAGTGA